MDNPYLARFDLREDAALIWPEQVVQQEVS